MSSKSRRRKKKSLSKNKVTFIIKVGTVVTAIILTVLLGVLIPRNMNKNSSSIKMTIDYEPGEDVISSLKKNEEIENLIDDDTSKDTVSISKEGLIEVDSNTDDITLDEDKNTEAVEKSVETTEEIIVEESTEPVKEDIVLETVTEDKIETVAKETPAETDSPTETPKEAPKEIPIETPEEDTRYVKDEWVDDMIQENQDSIDSYDLATGAAIYNKLDTGYLMGLAEGGMTDDEKVEAKAYLESNLSEDEYVIAIVLFNKYIGLAN